MPKLTSVVNRRLKLLSLSFRSSLDHPNETLSHSFTHGWKSFYGNFYPWYIHPLFKVRPMLNGSARYKR